MGAMTKRRTLILGLTLCMVMVSGCGGGALAPAPTPPPVLPPPPPPLPPPPPPQPQINHVVLVVLENHGFNTIFRNPAAPYLNDLAARFGLATNYFASAHGSLKDYFMLATGVAASENGSFIGLYMDDNLVRELIAAKKNWKSYAQSLPS